MRAHRIVSCLRRIAALAVFTLSIPLQAQERVVVLDRPHIIELVREQAPDVLVARARAFEVRALRVGAGLLAPANLALVAGPHFFSSTDITADFTMSLRWPIDLSGSRQARKALAEESVRGADAEVEAATRVVISEGLDLWVRALGALDRVRLETDRAAVDESLVRVAQARRNAGTTGDADVALAIVVRAEGRARLRNIEAERDASLQTLRTKLGLYAETPIEVMITGADGAPPGLTELLAGVSRRADIARAAAQRGVTRADATLQRRLGKPLPRLTVSGGRSGEYFADGGVEVPLPIYQRNQTNVAVADARIETSRVEESALIARAQGEIRAAYALYLGARAALQALTEAAPSIVDAEHLATRGYELGQGSLGNVLAVRREVAGARLALLEAQVAWRRARIAVEFASGILP
jgi:cobalt-zinc-cadmium efflux system outer membrane protein